MATKTIKAGKTSKATKAKFESEKLDMDMLDQVVAGAGPPTTGTSAEDEKKKALAVMEAATSAQASEVAAASPKAAPSPKSTSAVSDAPLLEAASALGAGIAKMTTQAPADAAKALGTLVSDTTSKLKAAYPGIDADTASAMAWSSAYKAVFETQSVAGKATGVVDALKNSITSHSADIARGLAAEVGYTGNLKASLDRTSDALAQSLKGVPAAAAEVMKTKAAEAYELGLGAAKNTGLGKAVMATIDDPKNIEAWKTAIANGAYLVVSPTWATPVKFLASTMADQATAKMIGLSDFPSEMKQTAKAMVNAFDGVEKAFVDVYASGALAAVTFGLDVKGVIHIGQNCGALGDAMVKGDLNGMKAAGQALVTDMMYDLRDGLKAYYVDAPTKAFNWTKDITVQLMDDLGATPYINMGAKATATAFTEIGNMAKSGGIHAMNVLEDFAKNEVAGALSTVTDLAKSGVGSAVNALEDVAKSGVRSATTALIDVVKLNGGAVDAVSRLITANVPGALAEVTKAATQVENATWALRKAAESGSTAALAEVSNLAKTAVGNFQRICVDGVQTAIVRGIPGALDKMADLISSDVKWARDSAQALIGHGGPAAQQLLDKCETLYGKASAATAVVEWAAKYAVNDVGKSAFNELQSVASKGGAYANQAIDSISNVARAGGTYANQAVDELKKLSGTVGRAVVALEDVAKSGVKSATTALIDIVKLSGNGAAIDAVSRLITANVPGALAEVTKAATQVESATWALRKAAESGSAAALTEVSNLAKTASGNFQRICVDGVQQAIVRGVPGAIDKMGELVANDVKWARDSAQHLLGQGGAAAQQLLDKCESLYGKAAGATAVVEWAAKYAVNDVGRSAFNELQSIANKGGAYANQAIDSISNVARAGGAYANQAVDELKKLSSTADAAKRALESVANDVGGYARTAWNDTKKVAEQAGSVLNPSNW